MAGKSNQIEDNKNGVKNLKKKELYYRLIDVCNLRNEQDRKGIDYEKLKINLEKISINRRWFLDLFFRALESENFIICDFYFHIFFTQYMKMYESNAFFCFII